MTDAQGKKFINLTGLHLFWQNVIKPKFDVLAGAVEDHGTQLSTLSANKADKSRFDNFNVNGATGKTIEEVIEDLSVAAGISGLKVNNTGNTLITVKANGKDDDTQHSGVVTISIDETALNTKFGAIEGAINDKAAQGDLNGAIDRITAAEGKITTAEGQIATLEGAISGEGGINGKIAGLESNKADKTALEGAVTRIGTAEGQIATLEGAISGEGGINSKIAGLESNKADKTDLEALSQTVATLENNAATKAELNEHIEVANNKFNEKADKSSLDTLSGIVGGKANQGELDALTQTVGTKASQDALDALSDVVDGKADNSTVTELSQTVGTKASQDALDALSDVVDGKASQTDLKTAEGKITAAEDKITALQTAVEALSSATDFIGVTSTAISDGSATNPVKINEQDYTAAKGDIVIYGNKEFIWDGAKWVELGDTTALAQDVETLKTAAETNANTALLVSEVEAAFNAGWA
jgi:hypothetical protein